MQTTTSKTLFMNRIYIIQARYFMNIEFDQRNQKTRSAGVQWFYFPIHTQYHSTFNKSTSLVLLIFFSSFL